MPTSMTLTAERTAITKPIGSDVVSLPAVVAMAQAIANRGEWNAKSLIDVKHAVSAVSDGDYNNAAFGSVSDGLLTFENVSENDIIVLHAATVWSPGTFTADGTDPFATLRWLIGGLVDATVGGDGAWPTVYFGSTALGADKRGLTCLSVHQATAPAATLGAQLQGKFSAAYNIVLTHSQVVGVHFRLGAT